jgi:hypothetical protein
MTSREIIRRVVEFDAPPRIGFAFSGYEGQARLCDFAGCGPAPDPGHDRNVHLDDAGGELSADEWGCVWRRLPGVTTAGEVADPPIKTWNDLETYKLPTYDDPKRYEHCAQIREAHPDLYMLGDIAACSFNAARYLRKLEQYLLDCAAEPEMVRRLNRKVSDLVLRQVDIYADLGADGVFFCEDWGTQERLLVSPRMWADIFRPDFERLISHAHSRGLTVWMHSCGYVKDIIPDLVDLGMDVLQFDQPDLHSLDFLAEFAGRVTYYCPVDIQKTLQTGDEAIIRAKAEEMVEKLGGKRSGRFGGFVAKDYGDEKSIGAPPIWQQWAYEAFVGSGQYSSGDG